MNQQLTKLKEKNISISTSDMDISVVYILFEEKLSNSISSENHIYGIEVKKIDNDRQHIESEKINGITSDNNFAEEIFNQLIKNKVMPCCLGETIDELVSQNEFFSQS